MGEGGKMNVRSAGRNLSLWGLTAILLFSLSYPLFATAKQLEITSAKASVHMRPDLQSPVLGSLSRGDVVTLASPRKFRRVWNYVYFTSPGSNSLKSGYVHDNAVAKLYDSVKCITFDENGESSHVAKRTVAAPTRIHWGMAYDDVRTCLGVPANATVMNEFRVLRYNKEIVGIACTIDYMFSSQNKLVKTRYSFDQDHSEKNNYIADFIKLNEFFEETYGKPNRDDCIWHDPSLKADPANWGQAVSLGHLSYETRWVISETEIVLNLSGKDEKVSLEVFYSCLNL